MQPLPAQDQKYWMNVILFGTDPMERDKAFRFMTNGADVTVENLRSALCFARHRKPALRNKLCERLFGHAHTEENLITVIQYGGARWRETATDELIKLGTSDLMSLVFLLQTDDERPYQERLWAHVIERGATLEVLRYVVENCEENWKNKAWNEIARQISSRG